MRRFRLCFPDLDPGKFEDRYETALVDLINQKKSGAIIKPHGKAREGSNVVDLITALKQSLQGGGAGKATPKAKRAPKKAAGQREMLLPIEGKKPAAAEKAASKAPPKRKAG